MKTAALYFLFATCGLAAFAEIPSEWAEKYLREATERQGPGVAVLVGRDGKILFQGGYGFADMKAKTPVTVETKFRIGSVTKQFTAAAILKLAEEGKLAITDPLSKFFPDFPNGGQITLRHLLTHTSGLHSYTEKPDFLAGVVRPIEPAALIASLQKDPPDFAPGTNFRYCNSGYFLLGEIVAKVSEQSLADYWRATFFDPLGMRDTGVYVNAAPPMGAARGYSLADGKAKPALDWDMSWAGGAGALYSTVGDLFRWTEALHGGRVINVSSLKAMTTPNPLPAGVDGMNYGFGLGMGEMHGLPTIAHGGGLQGWSSNLGWFPEQHTTVVALGNALPPVPQFAPGAVVVELTKHFLAEEIAKIPPPMEDKTIDPKTYAAFVGSYDYKKGLMAVSVDGNRIFAQLTGQPKFEIFPRAADEFFWKVADAKVHFVRDEKGKVVAAQHTQNGITFKAPRLAEPAVSLTPEQLDPFVGQYQYGPGAVLTVTRDGENLVAQLSGQPGLPIFAVAPDTFEWRVVAAKVRFVKGEDGKVTKAIHQQSGATIEAPKIK